MFYSLILIAGGMRTRSRSRAESTEQNITDDVSNPTSNPTRRQRAKSIDTKGASKSRVVASTVNKPSAIIVERTSASNASKEKQQVIVGVHEPAISELVRRRDFQLNAIQRANDFRLSEEFQEAQPEAIEVRIDLLQGNWNKFDEICDQIAATASVMQSTQNNNNRTQGEMLYVETLGAFKSRLKTLRKDTEVPKETDGLSERVLRVSMPEKLPEFDGDYTAWGQFHDVFESEVVKNTSLSDEARLRKLMGAVKGEARTVLGTWALKPGNFDLAWKKLKDRYQNDFQTIRAHVRKFFDLPIMSKCTYTGLRNILDTASEVGRQLGMLLPPEEVGEYLMLYTIENMLDPETNRTWKMQRDVKTRPQLSELYDFLERRASGFVSDPADVENAPPAKRGRFIPSSTSRGRSEQRTASSTSPCTLCEGTHRLYHCEKFKSLNREDRLSYLSRTRRCHNCFEPDHFAVNCPSNSACRRCPGNPRHNSRICPRSYEFQQNRTNAQVNQLSEAAATSQQQPSDSA